MKHFQHIVISFLAVVYVGVTPPLAGEASFLDVPYSLSGETAAGQASTARTLDVYLPSGPPAPLVVFVHGGGWRQGDKGVGRKVAHTFTADGYVFASVNYRLLPEATVTDMVADITDAIGFLLENAEIYNIDATRLGLMGHSAGGHLTALIASHPDALRTAGVPPEWLRALVLLDGVAFDVENGIPRNRGLLRAFGEDPAGWAELSPVARILAGAKLPPVLIAYGLDRPDTEWQACRLAQALGESGEEAMLTEYDKRHGQFLLDLGDPRDPLAANVLDFLQGALFVQGSDSDEQQGFPTACE